MSGAFLLVRRKVICPHLNSRGRNFHFDSGM